MFQHQWKKELGLDPRKKLPREGLPIRRIGDLMVWVAPLNGPVGHHKFHRMQCQCKCGQILSLGRISQHVCLNTVSPIR